MELILELLSHTNFFTFAPCILTQTPPPPTPYIFKTGSVLMDLRGELSLFVYFATLHATLPTSQANFNLPVHREGDSDGENRHVSVWYLQTPQPSAWIFEFSQLFCCAWDASATQTVGFFCVLRMRLIHRSSFMVRLQTAGQILLVLPLGLIVFDYINMT